MIDAITLIELGLKRQTSNNLFQKGKEEKQDNKEIKFNDFYKQEIEKLEEKEEEFER